MTAARPLAVVTGGSRGIGRAFVLEAVRRGYRVVFSYRNREAQAIETVEQANGMGGEAVSVQADLGVFEGVKAVAAAAHAQGQVAADIALEGTTSRSIAPFSPQRFALNLHGSRA